MAGSMRIWAGKPDTDEKLSARVPADDKRLITFYLLAAFSLGLLGFIVAWSAIAVLMGTNDTKSHPTAVAVQFAYPINNSAARFNVKTVGELAIGPENAPVTIVEFSDFQCPFCKRFYADVKDPLLQKYPGKIRFVFRDFPISDMHPYAETAAEAAHCAGDQGKFWEYHDLLFQNQPQLDKASLLAFARQLNLDDNVFQNCLDSHEYAQHVRVDLADGLALGVTGTPTFFINGQKLVGAQPLLVFSGYIDTELADSAPAAATK